MDDFWPTGLELSDTQSPMEILMSAQQDWVKNSGGLLRLLLREGKGNEGNDKIMVYGEHVSSKRTIALFSVVHRPGNPYPAKIQPEYSDLPDFLKKSYYEPGLADIASGTPTSIIHGGMVTNDWVSDTPAEFRNNLRKFLNLGPVKAEISSLASNTPASEAADGEKSPKKQTDDL